MDGINGSIKLVRASPQAENHRFRAFKLQTSSEPPDSPSCSPSRNSLGSNGVTPEKLRPLRQTSHSSMLSNGSPGGRTDIADGRGGIGAASPLDARSPPLLSPDAAAGENDEQWSSAVGRATTGGKSGRVIERLMSENDKLGREIKLYAAKADEEERRGESIRSELDKLRESNQTLESICDTNATALARKDRKIEELKEDLKNERERREAAQIAERDTVNQTTQALSAARADMEKEREAAVNAHIQYDVLRKAVQQMKVEHQGNIDKITVEVQALLQRLGEDDIRFKSLESINSELEHHVARLMQAYEHLTRCYQDYKSASDHTITAFRDQLIVAEKKIQTAYDDMSATTGRMKHVMGVKQHFKGDFND